MNGTCRVIRKWPLRAAICALFFALWVARCSAQDGPPPIINVPPSDATVQYGGTASFTTTIGVSLTPVTVEWRLNGRTIAHPDVQNITVPLLGTTISTLTITNASAADAGTYSAKVENGGGTIYTGNAVLTVLGSTNSTAASGFSFLPHGLGMTNGGFQFQLIKPANSNCVIEATADFITWTPVYTNTSASTNISYLDTWATNLSSRYYRARLQ